MGRIDTNGVYLFVPDGGFPETALPRRTGAGRVWGGLGVSESSIYLAAPSLPAPITGACGSDLGRPFCPNIPNCPSISKISGKHMQHTRNDRKKRRTNARHTRRAPRTCGSRKTHTEMAPFGEKSPLVAKIIETYVSEITNLRCRGCISRLIGKALPALYGRCGCPTIICILSA